MRNKLLLWFVCCLNVFVFIAIEAAASDQSAKHDNVVIPEKLLVGNTVGHDPDLFVSPESVMMKMKGKSAVFLVDVRNKAMFERFRIPGSMNIPIYAIKTKAALKTGSLVLINEGHSYDQMEITCRQLRETGFDASVLAGGLNRWRQVGGRLEGDPFAIKDLNKVMPQAWFQEKKYKNWIVIDATEKGIGKDLIPWSISVPFEAGVEAFGKSFAEVVAGSEKDPLPSVLIVSEDGEHYGRIKKNLKKSGFQNLFFLKGGFKAYRKYLEEQVLMGQGSKKRTIGGKGCPSCP